VAPDELGVEHVKLRPCFHGVVHFVLLLPYLMVLNLVTESLGLIFALSDHSHRLINQLAPLQHPLTNILSAVGALSPPQQTFRNALLAERVPTHCRLALDNQVHADRALEALNLTEAFQRHFEFGKRFAISFPLGGADIWLLGLGGPN